MSSGRALRTPSPPASPRSIKRTGGALNGKKRVGAPANEQVVITTGRAMAIELRKSGADYRTIARALTTLFYGPKGIRQANCGFNVSARTAFDYVQAELHAIRETTALDAESVRDLELERCDKMLASLWKRILKGDPNSVNAGIRIMERRSRLMGLDAPTKVDAMNTFAMVSPEEASKLSEDDLRARVKSLMERVDKKRAPDSTDEVEDV